MRVLVVVVGLVWGLMLWGGVCLARMSVFALWVLRSWWMIGLVEKQLFLPRFNFCSISPTKGLQALKISSNSF